MGKKLITIRELIEKDGRWYGGIEPGWLKIRKFGTNSYCFDGKEDSFWELFNDCWTDEFGKIKTRE